MKCLPRPLSLRIFINQLEPRVETRGLQDFRPSQCRAGAGLDIPTVQRWLELEVAGGVTGLYPALALSRLACINPNLGIIVN